MSQTYDANKPESGVTTFGQLYGIVRDHTETLRSQFSGATFPANPVIGQPCWHTNRNTAYGGALYFYSGDVGLGDNGWIDAAQASLLFNALQSEVTDGRGTAANLDARLSIALNDDGSLKTAAPAGSWWTTEGETVAYASASTFTIAGDDKTAIYKKDLALKLTQTTDAYCYVESAGHDGTYNTVTVKGGTVDAGLTAVDYGQPPGSDAMPDRLVLGLDAKGDIYHADTTGNLARLPVGSNGQVLSVAGGLPAWQNLVLPVGASILWNGSTPPAGFFEEDGSAKSRIDYADLFAVIGTTFGAGDGSSTFNLPDKRGQFLRIWDHGAGLDVDAAPIITQGDTAISSTTLTNIVADVSKVRVGAAVTGSSIPAGTTIVGVTDANTLEMSAAATGAAAGTTLTIIGDIVGTKQQDALQGHWHQIITATDFGTARMLTGGVATSVTKTNQVRDPVTDGVNGTPRISNETRPRNINVMSCIKH